MFRQPIVKFPNIKFHGNPWSGSRVVSCVRTDGPSGFISGSAGARTRGEKGMKEERNEGSIEEGKKEIRTQTDQ
jgi:hypothetical protein